MPTGAIRFKTAGLISFQELPSVDAQLNNAEGRVPTVRAKKENRKKSPPTMFGSKFLHCGLDRVTQDGIDNCMYCL